MLAIEMLPAQHGDCLWIEYGDPESPRRILVDCGLRSTYRELAARLRDRPEVAFELLVLTHIDADHIVGAIPLLQEVGPERFGDIWFNGWKHLPLPPDALGALHGEIFSAVLTTRGFAWNRTWDDGKAVVLPDDGPLPKVTLEGGLTLTLLSPTRARLADLKTDWNDEIEELDLEPGSTEDALAALEDRPRLQPDALGPEKIDVEALSETPFKPDDSAANGSSIVLLAEYGGKTILLGADAFSPVLEESLKRLLQGTGRTRLRLDACKVPHHGARRNNGPGFLSLLDCENFLFSTDGSHGYHHPHRETVARILRNRKGVRLHFNYRSPETEVWDDPDLRREWDYEALYPKPEKAGYRLSL